MFDNDIFASFIPQLLMLLGYLSCFLAPIIPTLSALNADLQLQDQQDVKYQASVYFESKSNNYVTDNQLSNYSIWDIQINTHVYTVDFVVIQNSLFNNQEFRFLSQFFSYSLFSRPPPFSC